jgi:high affinity Mn2+ porin
MIGLLAMICCLVGAMPANAEDAVPIAGDASAADPGARWSLHAQLTNVTQYHPPFHSPFRGANSLDPGNHADETTDLTLFAGARLWSGAEAYVNPEIDQGFGLSDTLGVAGFPSGEAYKVGATGPYVRLPRAFIRQVIPIGDDEHTIDDAANQIKSSQPNDNVTLTVGKFSVVDVFDTNRYAHDPRKDFLNWAIIDAGAFDYAADAWGYTYGAAGEWTESWWTVRAGAFDLSHIPNSKYLDHHFGQFAMIGELEERHAILGRGGKWKLLGFVNRARMADYADAVRLAQDTGATPDVALVRRYRSRPGAALNFEQEILSDVGVFARASLNDGSKEAYEFTEINRSVSLGISSKGDRWKRPNDAFGVGGAVNGISKAARNYFAAGGLGILIGDGRLSSYGQEGIVEAYYSLAPFEALALSFDYQYVVNPAYDRDRGPVSVFGLRVHAEL